MSRPELTREQVLAIRHVATIDGPIRPGLAIDLCDAWLAQQGEPDRLTFLLDKYHLWSEEGTFTFPDGETWQKAPEVDPVDEILCRPLAPPEHTSSAYYAPLRTVMQKNPDLLLELADVIRARQEQEAAEKAKPRIAQIQVFGDGTADVLWSPPGLWRRVDPWLWPLFRDRFADRFDCQIPSELLDG